MNRLARQVPLCEILALLYSIYVMRNRLHDYSKALGSLVLCTTLAVSASFYIACNLETSGGLSKTRCDSIYQFDASFLDTNLLVSGRSITSEIFPLANASFDGQGLLSLWHPKNRDSIYLISDSLGTLVQSASLMDLTGDSTLEASFARYIDTSHILVAFDSTIHMYANEEIISEIQLLQADETPASQPYNYFSIKGCRPSASIADSTISYCVRPYYRDSMISDSYAYPAVVATVSMHTPSNMILLGERSPINEDPRHGFASNNYFLQDGRRIITSFESDETICISDYGSNNDELARVNGKSSYDKRSDGLLDSSEFNDVTRKLRHLVEIGTYGPLFHDPSSGRYYRFFSAGIDYDRQDGLKNTLNDKPLYLQLFDHSMCLTNEIILDPEKFTTFMLPNGSGNAVYHKRADSSIPFTFTKLYPDAQ